MSDSKRLLDRLRRFNDGISAMDPALNEEMVDRRTGGLESLEAVEDVEFATNEESVVLRRSRPVLAIKSNETELVFADQDESEIWKARLTQAKPLLAAAIPAIGRVELTGSEKAWVGTGWLVSDEVVVTNRHVAREFANAEGLGFVFRASTMGGGSMTASLDFLQEIGGNSELVFRVLKVLSIEPDGGPDISFLSVERRSGTTNIAKPIPLASRPAAKSTTVAVIGYPARDSRIPEPELMSRIYGDVYNKKRLAPGKITGGDESTLSHDCSTLGGNSGSAIIDLKTGEAVGLHFSGRFLDNNYAVRADVVRQRLQAVLGGAAQGHLTGAVRTASVEVAASPVPVPVPAPIATTSGPGASFSFSIPVQVTVSVGRVVEQSRPIVDAPRHSAPTPADSVSDANEGKPADYDDRRGYDESFLGEAKGLVVGLPTITRAKLKGDILQFGDPNDPESVLRYQHYSVVMSKSRRMCFFSAVNIDGAQSKKTTRAGWRTDPRIPKSQQILNECYGSPPKFSRGHMTRREDPAWGSARAAALGNEDSMHVTNTVPQMQAFNAPIWLALEDYALQNAREDEMRISVFTGPYFREDDPTIDGVRIPCAFWKIIAFVHDKTKKLTATGYEMSQKDNLPNSNEFVYGAFKSAQLNIATQVSIESIQRKSGIQFGHLAEVDPLARSTEGIDVEAEPRALGALEEIRFF